MRRIAAIVLSAVMLLSMAVIPAAAEADTGAFRFTRENFPIMDGSTSLVPLGQGIAAVLLGESREAASEFVNFNRTTQSFRNLTDGCCDIVIAAEPKADVFDQMTEQGFGYEIETIAREALVFVVNADNPVDSLTSEQVRGIYSGTITNWKEVGGADLPIVAFQRNPSAGSQVMMEKLVMNGQPMMEAPVSQMPEDMGEMIRAVRGYDNSANAIGYTVFYYAADMQMAQGLKILRIDDCLPSAETIRSGEYPYLNGYYCCIPAEAAADSPARRLYNWLVSEAGQNLLSLEGYVPVSAPGEAAQSGQDIAVDYSAYAPNGSTPAAYTLFDCSHDHLEARDDYGLIYPYIGGLYYGAWSEEYDDFWAGIQTGFYNHAGQLITEPVYAVLTRCTIGQDNYCWYLSEDGNLGSVASKDGSYVTDRIYVDVKDLGGRLLAVKNYIDHTFDVLDTNLQVILTEEDFRVENGILMPAEYIGGRYWGTVLRDYVSFFAIMEDNGNVLAEEQGYIYRASDTSIVAYGEADKALLYDNNLNRVEIPGTEDEKEVFQINPWFYGVLSDDRRIVDRAGSVFEWGYDYWSRVNDNEFTVFHGSTQTVYDARGRVVARDIPSEWSYLGNGVVTWFTDDEGLHFRRLSDGKTLIIPEGYYAYALGEIFDVSCLSSLAHRMVDADLNLLPIGTCTNIVTDTDPFTGKTTLVTSGGNGFSSEQRQYTADGRTELFRANGSIAMQDGFTTVTSDWAFSAYDSLGNLVFCYPFFGMRSGD